MPNQVDPHKGSNNRYHVTARARYELVQLSSGKEQSDNISIGGFTTMGYT